jgi:predicted aconitase with swiveling domain
MGKQDFSIRSVVSGVAEGVAIASKDAFSFTGEFDPKTGMIINPHSRLFGECITNKIFLYPYGRGSSCTSAVLAEAIRLRTAPAAIINIEVEPILVVGALVAQSLYDRTIPIASISPALFQSLRSGDYLVLDTGSGSLCKK